MSKRKDRVRFYVYGISTYIGGIIACLLCLSLAVVGFYVVVVYVDVVIGIALGCFAVLGLIGCAIELIVNSVLPMCIEFTPTEIIKKSMFNKVKKRYSYDEVKGIQIRTFVRHNETYDWPYSVNEKRKAWLHKYSQWVMYVDCMLIDFAGDLNHEIDLFNDSRRYFFKSDNYFIFPYSKKAEAKIRRFTDIPIDDIREPKRKQQVRRREERQAKRIARKEAREAYKRQEEQEASVTDFDDDPFSKRRKR